MTQRGRYHRFVMEQKIEDMPLWGDWVGPYDKWVSEGMPPAPSSYSRYGNRSRDQYLLDLFEFEGKYSAFWGSGRLPVSTGVMPGFEYKVLEESGDYIVFQNRDGATVKQFKHNDSNLISTQFIDHALHGSSDWADFRDKHLVADHPGRYPGDAAWKKIVEICRSRDWVVTIDGGSFYGYIRDWMTVEGVSFALYEEPGWIHEVVDYLACMFIKILGKAVHDVPDIDAALFWEDMCFKTGPLCSPAMFAEFFLPGYKKVTKFLRDNGVFSFWVDCDGNIEKLIDLWIEGGVNGFYPMEVAAGMDPLKIKRKYGGRVLLWGGIDKRKIAAGKAAIDSELERVREAAFLGGYIPLVDHGIPDDISYENFCYYSQKRREIFGIKALGTANPHLFF
jgi:uroporphyrinogen decarboxylase